MSSWMVLFKLPRNVAPVPFFICAHTVYGSYSYNTRHGGVERQHESEEGCVYWRGAGHTTGGVGNPGTRKGFEPNWNELL